MLELHSRGSNNGTIIAGTYDILMFASWSYTGVVLCAGVLLPQPQGPLILHGVSIEKASCESCSFLLNPSRHVILYYRRTTKFEQFSLINVRSCILFLVVLELTRRIPADLWCYLLCGNIPMTKKISLLNPSSNLVLAGIKRIQLRTHSSENAI